MDLIMKEVDSLYLLFYIPGVKVCGQRGYFLKGIGVKLNYAIQRYAMDWLEQRGYMMLQTPFFMNKKLMAKTAQLSQFDEELYKVNVIMLLNCLGYSRYKNRRRRKRKISYCHFGATNISLSSRRTVDSKYFTSEILWCFNMF
jgi:hypothetical protein